MISVPSNQIIVVIKDMLHKELQFKEREGLNLVAMVGDIPYFENMNNV